MGRAKITASITAGEEEIPLGKDGEELVFDPLETSIPLYLIESALRDRGITGNDALLKIGIAAESVLKIRLEFSSYLR